MVDWALRSVGVEYFQAETEPLQIGLRIIKCLSGFAGRNGNLSNIAVDWRPDEIICVGVAYIKRNSRNDIM